jgi:hypothetical protein
MKYRKFGMLDWEASVLGFGVARLPSVSGDPAKIDEAESVRMMRYAVDHGVNYLDLGYPYDRSRHEGISRVVGKALRDGYRQNVRIGFTLPASFITDIADFDRYLGNQLRWLETDRIDFGLVGRLTRENWSKLLDAGVLEWADRALTDGRTGKFGFSFHDHFQILKNVINAYDKWSVCQFQYSYMDVDHDPGISGIRYAAEKGLAVVVTEPLRGGRLTRRLPRAVADVWAPAEQGCTLAEWGLRFAWNDPGVSTVVCDMSTLDQVKENVALAASAESDSLTVQEEVLIGRVRDTYKKLRVIPCPSCRPCMPCPEGVDVPRIFEVYNDAMIYDDVEMGRSIYRFEGHHAERCTGCGSCMKTCAKRLPILDWIGQARRMLGDAGGSRE